jgi:DNA polymerase-3 subunit alpha (Gram-positive type)
MHEKMVRFLQSLGIDDPTGFDLAFEAVTKNPLLPQQWDMVITKDTPWTFPQLEPFLAGMTKLNYPSHFTFTYRQAASMDSIFQLFLDWYQQQYRQPYPRIPVINAESIRLVYADANAFEQEKTMWTQFNDLLMFIHYPLCFKHKINASQPKVNQQKVDQLQEHVKAVIESRQEQEDDDVFIREHVERIKEAETLLALSYEQDVKQQINVEAKRKLRQKGDYQATLIKDIKLNSGHVEVVGTIYNLFRREFNGNLVIRFVLAEGEDAILASINDKDCEIDLSFAHALVDGDRVRIRGGVALDQLSQEPRIYAKECVKAPPLPMREDAHPQKRVELHLHTKMSTMDGVGDIDAYCALAKHMGHEAIAITDHGVVQGYPEAQAAAKKHGLKMIYGAELYMIDETIAHIMNPRPIQLQDTDYVIFDLETTGLSSRYDRIVEIGAIRVRRGEIINRLSLLIHPKDVVMSASASEVSGITMAMLNDQPTFDSIHQDILTFFKDAIVVSHNAPFDMGFMVASLSRLGLSFTPPVIDTLTLSRYLYPEANSHRLGALAKRLGITYEEDKAHRAIYDAEVLVMIWQTLKDKIRLDHNIQSHQDLNSLNQVNTLSKNLRSYHVTVLAKNTKGLKALYTLVSKSHLDYFADLPRTPRDLLLSHREHLLLGSACFNGEVFEIAKTGSREALEKVIGMYDFIEIQPLEQYDYLVHTGVLPSLTMVKTLLKEIIHVATQLKKMVVATGDVHYVNPDDHMIRDVYIFAKGLKGVNHPMNPYYRKDLPAFENPKQHYRSTEEMLKAFSWLDPLQAQTYVIDNPVAIAKMIEKMEPIQTVLRTPTIQGADTMLKEICFTKAHQQYGKVLPTLIEERLTTELNGIIQSGYAVIYYITSKIIAEANQKGFIVGSRGSVGSSFAATMAGITEVNPLPPHYFCPSCQWVEFSQAPTIKSGFDLPIKLCPDCGHVLKSDGQNIPFATFLGFNANKVPDIDLNFPRDYQSLAHEATKVLLGDHQVYRAGTIETVAEKTAYGYVKGYFEAIGQDVSKIKQASLVYLAKKAEGVRRTSGQHPGGIVVVPKEYSVYDFTPIQRPADNQETNIITTHFAFDSLHDSLLKFDMLGHVDPMALKMNADLTGLKIDDIPLNDPDALRCFASDDVLKRKEKYSDMVNGAMGLPEFGTNLGMDILNVINPKTFNDLVIISGLAHGTDVFNGNARNLITDKVASVDEVIGCRDDIMTYLISKGIDALIAFKIMEDVRKGKKLTKDYAELMRSVHVPEFYIESCNKIKYLFPKAHAVAYVTMAVRVAYFKVHHPLAYYATYFSLRSKQYDYTMMRLSTKEVFQQLQRYKNQKSNLKKKLSPKEADLEVTLMNVLEMKERGYQILPLDLEKSQAEVFVIDELRQGLIPPFTIMDGIGSNAALSVVQARLERPFTSAKDLSNRSKLSTTNIDKLKAAGVFQAMEADETVSLFSFDDEIGKMN